MPCAAMLPGLFSLNSATSLAAAKHGGRAQ
jgi:hypothetical protein